ncbi:MAG TPA: metallophosphoesterase [Armatimonadota bacterium]|nr:metallophosphoesterase [Armatimonadota bacterium]
MPILHILHTNDMHNHFTPAKATFIKGLKRHFGENCILLDAGDAVGAGNLGARGKEPILTQMADAGYDAMAMGNRESHPTQGALTKKLRDARFPVLAANLRAKQDRRPPRIIQDYIEFGFDSDEGEEFIVAIFGLAPQITPPDSWWAKVTDFVFDDPLKTGPGIARKLHPDSNLVIALTHIGYDQDVRLCESNDIDLVIGGHSHKAVYPPERHGHAYLAATEAYATHIGHLTVTLDLDAGISQLVGELIPLPE